VYGFSSVEIAAVGSEGVTEAAGFEEHCCECYGVVKREFDRLPPNVAPPAAVSPDRSGRYSTWNACPRPNPARRVSRLARRPGCSADRSRFDIDAGDLRVSRPDVIFDIRNSGDYLVGARIAFEIHVERQQYFVGSEIHRQRAGGNQQHGYAHEQSAQSRLTLLHRRRGRSRR
jgi:hypothetical protein